MPKFRVEGVVKVTCTCEVEASNEDEAMEEAISRDELEWQIDDLCGTPEIRRIEQEGM